MRLSHPLFGAGAHGGDVRTLFLRDLVCAVAIGAHARERGRLQQVTISVAVLVANPTRPVGDRLENVLDYGVLRQGVLDLAAGEHVVLQETLCESIADFCLSLPGVQAVHVSTGKLEAFADCAVVGCELIRRRSVDCPAPTPSTAAWSEA